MKKETKEDIIMIAWIVGCILAFALAIIVIDIFNKKAIERVEENRIERVEDLTCYVGINTYDRIYDYEITDELFWIELDDGTYVTRNEGIGVLCVKD